MYQKDKEEHALHRAATLMAKWSKGEGQKRDFREKCVKMVKLLLAHGAEPFSKFRTSKRTAASESSGNTTDSQEETQNKGFELVVEQHTVVHQVLLQNGIIEPFLELPNLDLEHRNNNGQTILLAACGNLSTFCSVMELSGPEAEHPENPLLVDILLRRGADTSARDNHGRNALHAVFYAAQTTSSILPRGQPGEGMDAFEQPLRSLLATDASLTEQVDNWGKTPLHYALAALRVQFKNQDAGDRIIRLLLSAGADPASIDSSTGDGALHFLVRSLNQNSACPGLFRSFLALGLDINARNKTGETPLFGLLQGPRLGEEPVITDEQVGRPGTDWPAPEDDAWRILEDAGADFRARDGEGRNMLHLAAKKDEWIEVYKKLVGLGLDPTELDHRQGTSLDVAAACMNEEVLGLVERE
jgi:ankyrin repeat protein